MLQMRQYSEETTYCDQNGVIGAALRLKNTDRLGDETRRRNNNKSQMHAQVGLVDAADALAIAKGSE